VAPIALDKPQRPSRVSMVRGQVGALGPGGRMRSLGVPVQNPLPVAPQGLRTSARRVGRHLPYELTAVREWFDAQVDVLTY